MTKSTLFQITALGGLGKIGGNSILVGDQQNGFLIDAGIEFPYESAFGLDYLVPPFDLYHIPSTVIITHGHEDHIGAIPFLLQNKPGITIYAPPFASSLIRHKLNTIKASYRLITYQPYQKIEVGPYIICPLPLPHSIPDTYGLMLTRKDHLVLYASDFKLPAIPKSEQVLQQLKQEINAYSHRILLADSTNIFEQKSLSDHQVLSNLQRICATAQGRILATCFSSNIERINAFVEIAKNTQKKIVPYGKSMRNYIQTACEHNYLRQEDFANAESISLNRSDLIILISGCQADFTSTLKRVAAQEDPSLIPDSCDTFIYSAKIIPGNESQVYHLFDLLSQKGVRIVTSDVHTSGHADREQLLRLYETFDPTHFVPVHGSHYHLKEHLQYFMKHQKDAKSFLMSNGDSFDGENVIKNRTPPKPHCIQAGQQIDRSIIKQRRKMASLGMIYLSIKTDSIRSRQLKFDFSLSGLSLLSEKNHQNLTTLIERFFKKNKIKNLEQSKSDLTASIRTFFKEFYSIKPVIVIHFI